MRLPGICIVCRQTVFWGRRSWRTGIDSRHSVKHVCPEDRAICGAMMPVAGERCARQPGHRTEHRTRYALDNACRRVA